MQRIRDLESSLRAERHGADGATPAAGYAAWRLVEFGVHDFTTMYNTLPHNEIRRSMRGVVQEVFARQGGKVLRVTRTGAEWTARTATGAAPDDLSSCKFYTAEQLMADIDFVLDNIFVTLGDDIYRQTLGVPMGFSCSPMLAVIMLSFFELAFVRRLVASTECAIGSAVDSPGGTVPLTQELRAELRTLAVRTACSCRAIDDVLLINISATDRRWVLASMYPATLELKEEHSSPGPILYLDMEIKHDRGGFYTDLYDKRDVLAAQGKMSSVLKFPHIASKLSIACKYGCMTSFFHRIHRGVMRVSPISSRIFLASLGRTLRRSAGAGAGALGAAVGVPLSSELASEVRRKAELAGEVRRRRLQVDAAAGGGGTGGSPRAGRWRAEASSKSSKRRAWIDVV